MRSQRDVGNEKMFLSDAGASRNAFPTGRWEREKTGRWEREKNEKKSLTIIQMVRLF
jgi:hypothetical protein